MMWIRNGSGTMTRQTAPMNRVRIRLVWLLTLLVAVGAVYQIVTFDGPGSGLTGVVSQVAWGLVPVAFAITATLIISRQPRNPLGWLLLVPAVGNLLGFLVAGYFESLTTPPPTLGPLAFAAIAYSNVSWLLLIYPVFHLLLVFPTGRLLSRRWRWAAWVEVTMISVLLILVLIIDQMGPLDGDWVVANPIGFLPAETTEGGLFLGFWGFGLVLLTVAGVTSMVMRYRRADRVERHQIKWLLYASAIFGVVYILAAAIGDGASGGVEDVLLPAALIGIPVAVAIAVLRYRLFEIDRVVSRTVGYAIVVGVLGVVYTTGAIWLPSLVSGDSPIFVALATLIAAALFNPLRRRVLHAVDRRFYRARYDSEHVVDSFKDRLRDHTDLDRLAGDWIAVVSETMQPSSIGVWVRHES